MQLSAPLKFDLGEVDEIASLLKQMLRAVGDNRVVQVVLSFGEKMQGVLHHEFAVEQARTIVGSTLDLDTAH